jgi:hybrid cluster-associated redox disulfide protein
MMSPFSQAFFAPQQTAGGKFDCAGIAVQFAQAQRRATPGGQTGSMRKIALPTTELTVDEVMRRWPSTIRIFLDFGMHCVGCPIATFHTVDDACIEHKIDVDRFLRRLQAAAQAPYAPGPPGTEPDSPSASLNNA